MKSNYHIVRANAQHKGGKRNWSYDTKRERTYTSNVRVIDPAEVPAVVVPSRVGVLPRQEFAMKSAVDVKRDK